MQQLRLHLNNSITCSAVSPVLSPKTPTKPSNPASGAEQDTGVSAPAGIIQVISAYIVVDTAEVTGTTKTVDVGIVGQPAVFLNDEFVSATGPVGAPITTVISGGANFSFTLASANFAELVSRCVITVMATDA